MTSSKKVYVNRQNEVITWTRCDGCNKLLMKDDLYIKTPEFIFCKFRCAVKYAKIKAKLYIDCQHKKKTQVKERRLNAKALKALNQQSLVYQHKKTQIVFNRLRKLQELAWFADRDRPPVCISCQKELGNDQWCCGHFKSIGANARLRYDVKNTYLQHNYNCNMMKSGDIEGYKKGIISRFGDKVGGEIIHYCETNNAAKKMTWQEIAALRTDFYKQIKAF